MSLMEIQLIEDEQVWSSVIRRFADYDVYHTWDYALAAEPDSAQPYLLYVKNQSLEFVLPVVKREFVSLNQRFYDFGSVYGYPGPIFRGDWSAAALCEAWEAVSKFLAAESIVCLVSRLNPFITSSVDLNKIGEVKSVNPMVAINLELTEEQQISEYRSNHRRDIKKLTKLGISCRAVDFDKHLDDFMRLYNSTMRRLGASGGYYFPDTYYQKLFSAKSFCTELYLCFDDNEIPVCGGIFFSTGTVIHYHLGATAESHLRLAPTKLLFDTVRRDSIKKGLKKFNLGGGVGGQEDNLFRFKAGFSKSIYGYELLISRFDTEVYKQLLTDRIAEAASAGGVLQENYYPQYRAPIIIPEGEN